MEAQHDGDAWAVERGGLRQTSKHWGEAEGEGELGTHGRETRSRRSSGDGGKGEKGGAHDSTAVGAGVKRTASRCESCGDAARGRRVLRPGATVASAAAAWREKWSEMDKRFGDSCRAVGACPLRRALRRLLFGCIRSSAGAAGARVVLAVARGRLLACHSRNAYRRTLAKQR